MTQAEFTFSFPPAPPAIAGLSTPPLPEAPTAIAAETTPSAAAPHALRPAATVTTAPTATRLPCPQITTFADADAYVLARSDVTPSASPVVSLPSLSSTRFLTPCPTARRSAPSRLVAPMSSFDQAFFKRWKSFSVSDGRASGALLFAKGTDLR